MEEIYQLLLTDCILLFYNVSTLEREQMNLFRQALTYSKRQLKNFKV